MYVPRHFELDAAGVTELLGAATTAQLVTAHADGPRATLLPVLHRPGPGHGSLLFHVTRTNDLWRDPGLGDALAILSGPDGYIDPDWYATHPERPSVPTWNYVTVHAWGPLFVHDDEAWKREAVELLSTRHGHASALPADVWEPLLRAIVGIEVPIARVQAKAKLGQNRSPEDVRGAVEGLRRRGNHALADAMESGALPHAIARSELVADVRSRRGTGRS